MRSFDWSMPEERNRVLTDHVSDLLPLLDADGGREPGARRGAPGARGWSETSMADVSLAMAPVARRESDALTRLGLASGEYLVVTAHRAGNVDARGAAGEAGRAARRLPLPARLPGPPAHARGARGGRRRSRTWSALERLHARPAARLPRLPQAAAATPPRS